MIPDLWNRETISDVQEPQNTKTPQIREPTAGTQHAPYFAGPRGEPQAPVTPKSPSQPVIEDRMTDNSSQGKGGG